MNQAQTFDGVSILVCCHNSIEVIEATLSHLAKQELPKEIPWEVVLVDNCSSDGTADVAKKKWEILGEPTTLKIVSETRLGLAWARRTAVMSSIYKTLIFCDDDNWLSPNYVALAHAILKQDSEIGCVGGCAVPVFQNKGGPPVWFWTHASSFAVGVQSLHSGDVAARGYLWGAGLAIRGNLLRAIYNANILPLLTGRMGTAMLAGDDSELCAWYYIAGYSLHYESDLVLQHFIPDRRLSIEYLVRITQGFEASSAYLSAYRAYSKRKTALQQALSFQLDAWARILKNEIIILTRGHLVRKNIRDLTRLLSNYKDGSN